MTIVVNGKSREIARALTVRQLLQQLGRIEPGGIAVAVNRCVVRRSDWQRYPLRPGDTVEILAATAGG